MVEIRNVEFVQQTVEFLSTFTRNPVTELRIVTRDVVGIIRSYSLLVFQFVKDSENRTLLRFQHDFECSKDNPVRVDLFVVLNTGRVLKLCTFSLCQQTVFTDDFIHVIHIPSDFQFAVSVTSNQSSSTQPTSQININTSVTPEPNTVPISDSTGKIHKDWVPQGQNSGLNADKLDDYHASQNPSPNTVVVSKNDGKIDKNWLPVVDQALQASDSDKVDGYHASQTPSPNTIPVSKNDGKLDTSWIPTNITVDNSDKVDNFHASKIPSSNTIPVANEFGKLDLNWIPQDHNSGLNADQVDGYHVSQASTPNTIPVSNSDGKLELNWIPQGSGSGLNADLLDGVNESQFVRTDVSRTITVQHTFNPTTPDAPFILGSNAQDKLVNGLNADQTDGFHASQTPAPNTIPVADTTGKIHKDWIPSVDFALNADRVDNYHASTTPAPNSIPVANSSGKLDPGWLPPMVISGGSSTSSTSETYSRLSVGTIEPLTPNHNDLFYNTTLNTLRRYDSRINSWIEIDWQNIIKASPEFIAGRLRVNSTTGKLEISPNGTNWYECIPAVGSNVIELATIDNTGYSYKYWIAPGQTVIIRNANHIPVVYNSLYSSFFVDCRINTVSGLLGLRPSNSTVSLHYQELRATGGNVSAYDGVQSIVAFSEAGNTVQRIPSTFVLNIMNNEFALRSYGQFTYISWMGFVDSIGSVPTTSYWLGTLYNHAGTQFTVSYLSLTRLA